MPKQVYQDVPDLKRAESDGLYMPPGLATSVNLACDRFFRSRNMPYGKERMEEQIRKETSSKSRRPTHSP